VNTVESRIEQLPPLERAVFALKETRSRLESLERRLREPIALVGMSCRFPGGANDPQSYWRVLCDGTDAIREIPADRWDVDRFYDADPQVPGKMNCRFGGFIDDIDRFDNGFFGISEEEAKLLDPQQRMLLELTWEALEDAGIPPASLRGSRTGVFIGISVSEYSSLMSHSPSVLGPYFSMGTAPSIAANRISFAFDFHGPSAAIDTACSSALVALHLAAQAIRNGDCTTAIVGGTNLILSPIGSIVLTKSGISAPDGHVKAFDRSADGYVRSEGAGVLVLKSLSAAEEDGDKPYALVRGSAVSQTGRSNGLFAPVGATQEATIAAACEQAGVSPSQIRYVETQGTGTQIGDAIEAKAIGAVIAEGRSDNDTSLIGSVKTNLGHLEAASGIASVMKVALSLKHRQVPPSLHFHSPNPMILFDALRLRVPTRLETLSYGDEPLVASVNGFGYGGSTAHVVLQDSADQCEPDRDRVPDRPVSSPTSTTAHLLPISARTESALKGLARAYVEYLKSIDGKNTWADICATATHRRDHHDCRLAIIAASAEEAVDQLQSYLEDETAGGCIAGRRPFDRKTRKIAASQALAEWENGDRTASALAGLYLAGADQELREICTKEYEVVRLPTYVWQRERFWTDVPSPWRHGADAEPHTDPNCSAISQLPMRARPDLNAPYEEPKSRLQRLMADAWSRILRVEPVGIHDNFFELGGQSLQAAMLLSEVQTALDVQIDFIALFESQTIDQLSRLIEEQYPAAMRNYLDGAEAMPGAGNTRDAIPRIERDRLLPLSFGQERFWFLDQLFPGAPVFNTHLSVPLDGPLDCELLQSALSQAIARHESLRTVIRTVEGEASQQILPPRALEVPVVDLTGLDFEDRRDEIRRLSQEQAGTAFRLDEFPLFRIRLLRLSDSEHILLLTIHHIIVDGVSLAILLRDVMEFYEAGIERRAARLPELPVQYADFAAWQRKALEGETLENELAYWREKLANIQPLRLHFDRPRSSDVIARPGTHKVTVPRETFEGLQAVCRQNHVTPFVLMLAAFKVLLSRYSSQEDIVVGVPVAGRTRREVADVVGFFVNTLALRTDVSGDPTFGAFLQRVRTTYIEAVAHQDAPFDRLAKKIEPEREPNRHPVFQVLFNYLQQLESPTSKGSDRLSIGQIPTEQPPHGGEFDLVLTLAETGDALDTIIGFNAALFDQSTIERVGGHLKRLLECIARGENRPLSKLEVLDPAEERRLLVQWNDTATSFSADKCLDELVEEQVARTPNKVAAVYGSDELTFEQLNRRSNQLAHLLRQRGARPDQLVGLCVPRSLDAIVAMLGILKSGAAFLPIDPALPPERVAAMLDDAQVDTVVTHPDFVERLPSTASKSVCVSSAMAMQKGLASDNLERISTPRNLAYAVFTSGSTGRPKGVLIEHRSVVNVVECFINTYQLDAEDRVLQNTSLSFDVSINEIFPALSSGATVVVSDDESQLNASLLARVIEEQRITIAAATPTVLSHLNREVTSSSPLRLVLSGGEALSYANIDRLLESAVVTNGYGPTEACIAATCYELKQGRTQGSVPVGRPLTNYRIYIVDAHLAPVPIGCAGELCIAGVGLARGYANDPDLTAEKFVECPFELGQRMYRTGDLARWLPNGNIGFLGRIDRQIKLRGLRIELGEIECSLEALPQVESAAVVNRQSKSGDTRLVAYVVPDAKHAPASAPTDQSEFSRTLAESLGQRLPQYMIPSAFELLPAMPINASGKTDYQRLPDPAQVSSKRQRIPPRTPLEQRLAKIWCGLFAVDEVGVHDDFFELGGYSLLAVKAVARIREETGLDLPVGTLFVAPTIAKMAMAIEQAEQAEPAQSLSAAAFAFHSERRSGADGPLVHMGSGLGEKLFVVHGMGGYVNNLFPLGHALDGLFDVTALQACGPFDDQPPHSNIPDMAAYYVDAIRKCQPTGDYSIAGWSLGGTVAWEMCRQLLASGALVRGLTLLDSYPLWTLSSNLRTGFVASRLLPQLGPAFSDIQSLPKQQRWPAIADRAREYSGAGSAAIRRLVRTCEAHLAACGSYIPEKLDVDVTAFWARKQWGRLLVSQWRKRARSYVSRSVPGDHYSMLEKPCVDQLATEWRRLMAADSPSCRKAG